MVAFLSLLRSPGSRRRLFIGGSGQADRGDRLGGIAELVGSAQA
jgi:hypothetical protein